MPLPSRGKSFLAATWARGEGGNGSAARAGRGRRAGRGDGGPGGAGRGQARGQGGGGRRAAASLRVRGRGAAGPAGAPRRGDRAGAAERRAPSACGGSWRPSPAARSPPLYPGRSGITTAEGLRAPAR